VENQDNSGEMRNVATRSGEELPTSDTGPGTEFPDELLDQLIGGTQSAQSSTSDSETAPEGTSEKPQTLNALAKSKGLDLDDLYNATIALPDEQGEMTLSELKNQAAKFKQGGTQRESLVQDETEFANAKLRYMSELQQAVAALPAEVLQDEEKLAPVAQFIQTQQAQQDRLLLGVIPGWQDEAVKARDNDGIKEFIAGEYGAPPASWDQPAPAWIRKLVYDHWQLNERMKAISQKRKTSKAAKSGANAASAATDRKRGAVARANATGEQLDAIVQLIQQ